MTILINIPDCNGTFKGRVDFERGIVDFEFDKEKSANATVLPPPPPTSRSRYKDLVYWLEHVKKVTSTDLQDQYSSVALLCEHLTSIVGWEVDSQAFLNARSRIIRK